MLVLRPMHPLYGYLSGLLALFPLALLLRAPFLLVRAKSRRLNPARELGVVLFVWYLLGVLSLTVNVRRVLMGYFTAGLDYNLIPFEGIAEIVSTGSLWFIVSNLAGNLLLLAPLGFGLPLFWQGWAKWYRTIPAAALLSFSIELLQFYTGRTADVDDLIFNAAGAALGYLGFACVKLFAPRVVSRLRRGCWMAPAAAVEPSEREPVVR